jgi:hypothetical protein
VRESADRGAEIRFATELTEKNDKQETEFRNVD